MNEKQIHEILEDAARKIAPDARFTAELEKQLKEAHKPQERFVMFNNKNFYSTLGFVGAVALLLLALNWAFRSLAPKTIPGAGKTPLPTQSLETTPAPQSTPNLKSYDFRGTKLYLAQSLPESPDKANVYLLNKDQPATLDEARALAQRFGIQSDVYTTPGQIPNTTDYVFTDGKQMLTVHSNFYFTYIADTTKNNIILSGVPAQNQNAEAAIIEFLKSHGVDFPFRIETDGYMDNGYFVRPLAPDGLPMQYEHFSLSTLQIILDENGQVLKVIAALMNYNQTPVGTFGIISAEDALRKLLDDSVQAGKIESVNSPTTGTPQEWRHQYPDNQPVTIYGYISSYPAFDPGKPTLILIDGVPATGNIQGMDKLANNVFVQASGQYVIENGIRKFNVDSWNADNVLETSMMGTLHRNGDQIVLTSNDGSNQQYVLIDPPSDLPLETNHNESQLSVGGVIVDGKIFWTYIQYFDTASSHGGGGGGGLGFYQLNLSGTPMPFPTATPVPGLAAGVKYTVKTGDTLSGIAFAFRVSMDALAQANNISDPSTIYVGQVLTIPGTIPQPTAGQKIEKLHGTIIINIYKKSDGSQRTQYGFSTKDTQLPFIELEGADPQVLQNNNGRPADIWGTVDHFAQDGTPVVKVNHIEITYLGLKFQVLRGTQKSAEVQGQSVIIFTTDDGTSYVQVMPDGTPDTMLTAGILGQPILMETLAIPGEKFGDYPAIHGYQAAMAINPKNGQPMELQITADQPHVMDESQTLPLGVGAPTSLTIEKVELVYFVSNPLYQASNPGASKRSPYIQPAWKFSGHYGNGDEFEILIQAVKQEFLLPETSPYIQGG